MAKLLVKISSLLLLFTLTACEEQAEYSVARMNSQQKGQISSAIQNAFKTANIQQLDMNFANNNPEMIVYHLSFTGLENNKLIFNLQMNKSSGAWNQKFYLDNITIGEDCGLRNVELFVDKVSTEQTELSAVQSLNIDSNGYVMIREAFGFPYSGSDYPKNDSRYIPPIKNVHELFSSIESKMRDLGLCN